MKKYTLWVCQIMLVNGLFAAPGIVFEKGGWKEVLAKAKKENKLVFVDVYTSWCGPCKKMVAEVFPMAKVGKVFNASFVNFQLDAEKGEGVELASRFGVRSYPTYLFINGDGVLVYRIVGYMPASAFLKEAAIAIKEKNDPKPLVVWEEEYLAGNRSKSFLMGYLQKRASVKIPNGDLIEALYPQLNQADLSDNTFLSAIFEFDPNITFVPGGKFYQYVITNHHQIDQVLKKPEGYTITLLDLGIDRYFSSEIIPYNQSTMLPVMLASKRKTLELLQQEDIDATIKGEVMKFYSGTKNEKELIASASDYVNNGLMKMDIPGKIVVDKIAFQKMREPYLRGTEDSTKVENWLSMQRILSRQKMVEVSYNFRNAAEAIYKGTANKNALAQALVWAKTAEEYFPHFSNKAVYAGLLFKCGHKQQALAMMTKASEDSFIAGGDESKRLLANVALMKSGKFPDKLW